MDLKQYLTSLFNCALDRGMDWVESDFSDILDVLYEKHGYEMLHVLKDVIINPNTDDWCVEIACAFYTDVAQRKHRDKISDILYEIVLKHENWIHAGCAAGSLLYLNRIKDLEHALNIVTEEKRKYQIMYALLHHAVAGEGYRFGLNHVIDLVLTADEFHLNHVLNQTRQTSELIVFDAVVKMLNSKYISNSQTEKVLSLLKENLTKKQFKHIYKHCHPMLQ